MTIRKIGDLPKRERCRHPGHQIPNMIVLEPGVYEHTCPGCGERRTFTVPERPSLST